MVIYTKAMEKLIQELSNLPGIGQKTAERLAFYILSSPKERSKALAQAILDLMHFIGSCKACFNLSEGELCEICKDTRRDRSVICVVENPKDIAAIEKSKGYNGLYHVLLGALSPLDGIGPDDLKIRELAARVKKDKVKEVVIATGSDTEGESTAIYLAKVLKPLGVRLTRIACGIPAGSALEYADQTTLSKALEGRREIL